MKEANRKKLEQAKAETLAYDLDAAKQRIAYLVVEYLK